MISYKTDFPKKCKPAPQASKTTTLIVNLETNYGPGIDSFLPAQVTRFKRLSRRARSSRNLQLMSLKAELMEFLPSPRPDYNQKQNGEGKTRKPKLLEDDETLACNPMNHS